MSSLTLFDTGHHKNVLLEDFSGGLAVQANQHLIIHGGQGLLLDPGGHKVYNRVLGETLAQLGPHAKLRYLFLSHQDPDIVAAVNGWLMTTDAEAYASKLWIRFIPHFGLDRLVEERLRPIPDPGMTLDLGGCPLELIPAHFLHSAGNFHIYDPISKILYSGDLGATVGVDDREVTDFEAHRPHLEAFHRRYMASQRAAQAWAARVRDLDIETIAPQHGALLRGKSMVEKFIAWAESTPCGVDLIDELYGRAAG
ncbi:MAG: FprA family A-type flavoprotein [Kofleriaceae bacterium]|jgi:flavorubredoxin|nr:FprA family A-type flavoprotein [Kofleriaceae bacterium]MBP9166071.1 FprA family A-type flavoprotein [Kofleriaceae bacterium]MBP9856901.1 FprA family A-type flavoprotein [Kofleriaceae bacterium]